MATLLTNRTTDGAGTGVSHTGPCTVFVPNDSVFDNATVHVEAYSADSSDKYVCVGRPGQLGAPGAIAIDIQGAYFLRGKVARAGPSTSISMETTQ